MELAELSTMLKPFFTQKPEKSVEGKLYSCNTVNANSFRAGQIFFLVPFKESRFLLFGILANEALNPSLKDLARQGLISFTKHKRPISSEDLGQLGLNAPESFANSE